MQLKSAKLSKAAALLAVGLMTTSFMINNVASAFPYTKSIDIAGDTGCYPGNGSPYSLEPNQGVQYHETEYCNYQGTNLPGSGVVFRFVGSSLAFDCHHVNIGGCTFIDTTSHCPTAGHCDPTHPGQQI